MPTSRFRRVARRIKLFFDLDDGKSPVRQGAKPGTTHQRRRSLKRSIADKRSEAARLEQEIRSKKNLEDRYGPRKDYIEVRQEMLRLKDDLRASKGDGAASPRSTGPPGAGSLPDFVVIGAQKCGTSTFYDLLTIHPHIKPAASKELHYFDAHFEEGVEWYRRCFPSPKWKDGHRTVTGEATPAYVFWPDVAEKMSRVVPDAKLVVLLRNPVDRAHSHYHHQVRLSAEVMDFESAIDKEAAGLRDTNAGVFGRSHSGSYPVEKGPSYLARGIYADQLQHWLRHFEREQLLVIGSERFFGDPSGTLKEATNFLGLPDWTPPGRRPRNKGQYTPMSQATRQRLTEYFEPHNQRLYELLGQDFHW